MNDSGVLILKTSSIQYLGVIIDEQLLEQLDWNKHIDTIFF